MDDREKEELRKYDRFHLREDIYIDGTRCECMDISESGIYVAAQYFATGETVDVTLPFNNTHVTIRGQVQHCENGFGAGIKFIDLNDDDKTILKQLIHFASMTSASHLTEDVDNSTRVSLTMYGQNEILEALITLLNEKQMISEKELLAQLLKKTGDKKR